MLLKRILGTAIFCTLIGWSMTCFAKNINLTCPDQDYVLTGNDNNYYFIQGVAQATGGSLRKNISVQGRFLNPGFPSSLKLQTISTEAQSYDDRRGISFYCNLSNDRGVRVAFVRTSFLLKDIGVNGLVAGCVSTGPNTVCEITSAQN